MRRMIMILAALFLMTAACKPEYPKCKTDDHCSDHGEFCVNGLCQRCRTIKDCGVCETCNAGRCDAVVGCCTTDRDCAAGQLCKEGQCEGQEISRPAGVVEVEEEDVCSMEKIYFDFDEYLLNEGAREALLSNVRCLREREVVDILLEGHCDERGTENYNLALGDRRATSVGDYLKHYGFMKIRTVSYGENRPAACGHDEDAWKMNRRVEFIVK